MDITSKIQNQLLPIDIHNKELLEILSKLHLSLDVSLLQSRRKIKNKINKQSANLSQAILLKTEEAKNNLQRINENVHRINRTVDVISNRLYNLKCRTDNVVQKCKHITNERKRLDIQKILFEAYINKFQLSVHDVEILQSKDMNMEVFNSLSKIDHIHGNCDVLTRNGYDVTAQYIAKHISTYQEMAVKNLYKWAQAHCKDVYSVKTKLLLTKSLSILQNSPSLFNDILEEYATARRALITESFIKHVSTVMSDVNVIQYVGQMLSYIHQSIYPEIDLLNALLAQCDKADLECIKRQVLSNITEGFCRLFKTRVEFLLQSIDSPFILYRMMDMFTVYMEKFSEILSNSSFEKTLQELSVSCEILFMNILKQNVNIKLLENVQPPAANLSPTRGVYYMLNYMSELVSLFEESKKRTEDTIKIVNLIIEPLFQALESSASRLSSIEASVYLLNCVNVVYTSLSKYEFLEGWLNTLKAMINTHIDTLTSEQSNSLVANFNLSTIYTILQDSERSEPMSHVPGMTSNDLNNLAKMLEESLKVPEMLLIPKINLIQNMNHRYNILNRSNNVLSGFYRKLYECVHDEKNLYENADEIMPLTPDEIDKMLNN